MPELVEVPVPDLLLDIENPRIENPQADQQEAALRLAEQQGERLLRLAAHIVDNGVDPLSLIAVVAVGSDKKQYKVLEGNRRVLALKALETPSLVNAALRPGDAKKLATLSGRYASSPVDNVLAMLFENEDDAQRWVELRHTGANQGSGLVEWGAAEKDRYHARHGVRTPAGQVIEFVERHGSLSEQARASDQRIITSLSRLLSNPEIRRTLGIDVVDKQVIALVNQAAVAKSLSRVVEDLKTTITVKDLYHAPDRKRYISGLPATVLPTEDDALETPVSLSGLTAGETKPKPPKPKPPRKKRTPTRTTIIPKASALNVTHPRISAIHNELATMSTEQVPNACAVLLRVFLELSVDHYIASNKIQLKNDTPLAKRLKTVSEDLYRSGKIPQDLKKAVEHVANGPSPLAPGVSTFNQYVHNGFKHPKPSELYAAWDELQPLMEVVWP